MAGSDLSTSLNKSGQTAPTPREYNRHQRHAKFARFRHTSGAVTGQLGAFCAAQATRLSSTSALVFAKLVKNTAARIKAAATFGSLS